MFRFSITQLFGIFFLSVLFVVSAFIVSCAADEENRRYPALLSEFVEVTTTSSARLDLLCTDAGERLPVSNSASIETSRLTPDSTYRAIGRYERVLSDNGVWEATLYALQLIPSSYAVSASSFSEIKRDPVAMQSLWRGGNYLNIILLVKAQNGKHLFRFIDEGMISSADGVNTFSFSLYHDAAGDVEAYTQKVYLSIPLSPYAEYLSVGDTLSFAIPTSEGTQVWKTIY